METNTTLWALSEMYLSILVLMYQFLIGKVAEIGLEIHKYYNHVTGVQVRFLMCPEVVRIRFLRTGVQQLNGIEVSEGAGLLYSKYLLMLGK